jgi:hypothetical protein
MVSRFIIGCLAAASVTLAAMPVHADSTLQVQGSDGLNSTIQVRNGMGRVSSDGRGDYLLYDSGTGVITYVEPQKRQYTQMTAAELVSTVQAASNISQSMAPYMDDLLAGLSPEQRKMIEQRMGRLPGAPAAGRPVSRADVRTVDRGRYSVAGLRCQASWIMKNGRHTADVCMATAASGKLSQQDFATLESLVTLSRNMAGTASGFLGGVAGPFELLAADLDGVPVAVHDIENGRRYQVTAVSNAVLSDAHFNAFGNFRKQGIAALFR